MQTEGEEEPSSVFTSLRYDILCLQVVDSTSPLYLPDLHRQRLKHAANYFNWSNAEQQEFLKDKDSWEKFLLHEVHNFQQHKQISASQPLKIRVDVDAKGTFKTTIAEVSPTTIDQLYPTRLSDPIALSSLARYDIILDWMPTPISTYTWLKTARREHYDIARQRMLLALAEIQDGKATSRGDCEIILHNTRNEVTEGSVSNIYLWRDGWITPPVGNESGGLEGVARRWAIESGLCKRIEMVRIETVRDGDVVWISNGVRGFQPGVVRVTHPNAG